MTKDERQAQLLECVKKALNMGVGAVIPLGAYDYQVVDDLDGRFHTSDYLMQLFVSRDKTYFEVCVRVVPSFGETLDDCIIYLLDAVPLLNERLDPRLMTKRQDEQETQEMPRAVLTTDDTQEMPRLSNGF